MAKSYAGNPKRKKAPPVNLKSMRPGRRTTRAKAWYEADSDVSMAQALCAHVDALRVKELATYRSEVLRRMRLYAGGMNVNGTSSSNVKRVRFNLIKSVVDTGAAVLGAARTLPFHQTRGADWGLRRKAMLRNQGLQQQYQDVGTFTESLKAILDALVGGLGVLKYFEDESKPGGAAGCERLLPLSIIWDPAEAVHGLPPVITQIALWNRDVLADLHPDHADAIHDAPGPNARDKSDFQLTASATANQCIVYETWKLPASDVPDGEDGDGLHVICVPGAMLRKEPWKVCRYPLAFLRGWGPNQLGLPGVSLVELCEEAQVRIEEISEFVRECQILGSTAMGFIPNSSKVEPAQLDNLPMRLTKYDGPNPPTFYTHSATPPDLQDQYTRIREETLSMLGLSVQQVQGEKPAGVNSAVGQRAYEDIASKRHVVNLRFMEQFYLDCAQCLVDVNDRIASEKPAFAIDRSARNFWLESSKWKELSLREGEAKMAVLPVSALVGSVSAQFETMQSWVQAGWVDQPTAKMLAGHPDTEGQAEDDTEDKQYAQWLVDQVLDGKMVAVDPVADQLVVATSFRTEYLRAKRLRAPEPILGEFRRVLGILKQKDMAIRQAAEAQQAASAAPPPADPQMAPLSPLVAA